MMRIHNQPETTPSLKGLTGRRRKWDARVTPHDVVTMMSQELKKAPWLLYVCVLESGEIIPASTPASEALQRIEQTPAVGFVGCLRRDADTLQFFTKALKVRPEHQRLLDQTVNDLRNQAEQAITTAASKIFSIERPSVPQPLNAGQDDGSKKLE